MSELDLTPTQERSHLIAQIARQRGELADAYRNLAKPIQYTEYGLRGFGFLRANPWILTLVPALVTTTTTIVGAVRNKSPKTPPRRREKAEKEAKGFVGHVARWSGRGLKLFKLYRTVRKFLP